MDKVELYARVRQACMVEGVSTREAARVFGLHRDAVSKMPRPTRRLPGTGDSHRPVDRSWTHTAE